MSSRQTVLGAFYRRIRARAGAAKAIVATARKLAERVYRLLKYRAEQELEAYEAAYRKRLVKGLARRGAELGYRLELATSSVGDFVHALPLNIALWPLLVSYVAADARLGKRMKLDGA